MNERLTPEVPMKSQAGPRLRLRLEDMSDLPTLPEVASVVGCSVQTVRRMLAAGILVKVKVGRLDRATRASVERLVKGQGS